MRAWMSRVNEFLDRHVLPWPVRFLTFRFVILATICLLIPLIAFANNTALVLLINSYLNTMSVAVSSIVLLYATINEKQQRHIAELQEQRAEEDHAHITETHELMMRALANQHEEIQDLKELIETATSGNIAAFMAEPILGVGGYITPPKEYFKEAVAIVRQYGGVFITDEVQTGWGRTGDKWFGIEHWDVEPDIITSAKGMAAGFPIGWTIATPEVANAVPTLTFSTFGGNPVSSRAALATIEVIETENLVHSAKVVGDHLREKLMGLMEKYEIIGDVRGLGLMQALELVKDRKTKEPNSAAVLKVFEETKKRGVLIGKGGLYGNCIRIGPPLIATKDDMDEMVTALDEALATI